MFGEVLRGLGSRSGGLTAADVAELERLQKTIGASAPGLTEKRRRQKVAFRCGMLMARGCDEQDDSA